MAEQEPAYVGIKDVDGWGWKVLVQQDARDELRKVQDRLDAGETFTAHTVATARTGDTREVTFDAPVGACELLPLPPPSTEPGTPTEGDDRFARNATGKRLTYCPDCGEELEGPNAHHEVCLYAEPRHSEETSAHEADDDAEQEHPLFRGPRYLGPLDEAHLQYAARICAVIRHAMEAAPLPPYGKDDRAPGEILAEALTLRHIADLAVDAAVIAERERGTTWKQLAENAGVATQNFHRKHADTVRDWAVVSNRRYTRHPSKGGRRLALRLDDSYARLDPTMPDAFSRSLAPSGTTKAAAADRTQVRALRKRLDELFTEREAAYRAYEAKAAVGQNCSAEREAWAATYDETAALYDQLATAEPVIADEHRTRAREHRRLAAEFRRPGTPVAKGD